MLVFREVRDLQDHQEVLVHPVQRVFQVQLDQVEHLETKEQQDQ